VIGKEGETDNLYDYFWKYKLIPLPYVRMCTGKFKIQPIRRWLFKNLEEFEVDIGISYEEKNKG